MDSIRVTVEIVKKNPRVRPITFVVEVDKLPSFYEVMKDLQQRSPMFCSCTLEEQEKFAAHEYIRRYLLDADLTDVMMTS